MKTSKKVFAGIVMAAMVLTTVMSVSAADSKEKEVYLPIEGNEAGYVIDGSADKWEVYPQEVQDIIKEINESDKVTSLPAAIQTDLQGKTLIWEMFDLDAVGNHTNCANGHTVKLGITTLTKNVSDIVVVHYDKVANAWETIQVPAKDIDYANKTITVTLKNLSPVGVFAKVAGSASGDKAPQTGVPSSWMLYAAVALVVVGAGVVVSQKKNRR